MSYDLTGQKFGYLTVINREESDPKRKEWRWRCLCECGNYTVVPSYRLRHGGVTSCGCHQRDCNYRSKKAKNHPRLYQIYRDMKARCKYESNDNYYLYGGRGIKVCDEWKNFDAFCDWALEHGYDETAPFGKCTIDRIDSNGDYSPDNCRFIDAVEQANNRRNNHYITFQGKTQTIAQWERERGFRVGTISNRLKYGWSEEEAISLPILGKGERYCRKNI